MSYPEYSIPKGIYKGIPASMPPRMGFNNYGLRFYDPDMVSVLDDPTLDVNRITMWVWIKLHTPNTDRYFAKHNAYHLRISAGGVISIAIYDAGVWHPSSTVGFTTLAREVFYFVAGTYDGAELRMYLNGKLEGAPTPYVGNIAASASNLLLGFYLGWYPNATVAQCGIYNRAMSPVEIRNLMLNYNNVDRNGLMLYLPLEEGRGLTAYDLSGNGNNGSLLPGGDPPIWVDTKKWELRAEVDL